jgi:hypothetical protein
MRKKTVEWAEGKLNDSYLMEVEPSHDPNYELRLFGILSSSRGDGPGGPGAQAPRSSEAYSQTQHAVANA